LKYFYAVAECDSVQTAEHVYSNCDGMEYETSGTRLDLRFIPDGMEFDQQPKDEATSFGDLSTYRPNLFVNKALQQSRPVLTWEEERDPKRVALTKKAFENPDEWDRLELNGILASPSSSEASDGEEIEAAFGSGEISDSGEEIGQQNEENGEKSKKGKGYKKLLLNSLKKSTENGPRRKHEPQEEEDDDVEMEIKWDTGVEENLEKSEMPTSRDEKKMSQWEKYLERRKEKRRQRKEEIRRKRLEVKQQRQGFVDEDDDFPSDFEDESRMARKTKKKRKRTEPDSIAQEDSEEKRKRGAELELLLAESDEERKGRHFNLKKILKEEKKKPSADKTRKAASSEDREEREEEDFSMNVEDPRFKAIFNSHLYNIDPSDPAFKKTPGMKRLLEEKVKVKAISQPTEQSTNRLSKLSQPSSSLEAASEGTEKKANPELSLLAKRVKAKSDMLKKAKEQRKVKKSIS